MIKNIIFDLGGVILNIDFHKAAEAFKDLGITNFENLYSRATQSNLFINLELGVISDEEFYTAIRELSGISISNEDIKVAWNELLLDFPKERLNLLKNLAGNYKLFLLSNTNKIHYDSYQNDLQIKHGIEGLEKLFEKCYFSHDIGIRKPEPESYNYVLEQNNLRPEETLFIDDTVLNIDAAVSVGVKALFINIDRGDDVLDYFEDGKIGKLKPYINTDYTSATNLFKDKVDNMWDDDNAPILVGIGIRTPANIGGLIRLAGTIGCKKVLFADDKRDHKISKIKKSATNGFTKVNWSFVSLDNWNDEIPSDYTIIAMETTPDAKMIYDVDFPEKVAIVVGDESYGIYMESLQKCDSQLYIPMNGIVKSLNVVQAAGVTLYELLRQRIKAVKTK
ncbi:MAG: HAD-IA family hydrolase [Bacteroidales bacterium]|nr:HAD-IA family hydrolase [Bacteroidales bacterium]